MHEITVSLSTSPLNGVRQICSTFGVSRNTMLEWVEKKAPIACIEILDKTVYVTEFNTLFAWLVENNDNNKVSSYAGINKR